MKEIINNPYFYYSIPIVIVAYKIFEFILKRLFRRFRKKLKLWLQPFIKFFNFLFGSQKMINYELLTLLFGAILFIVYLLYK